MNAYQIADYFMILGTFAVPFAVLSFLKKREKHLFLNYLIWGSILLLFMMVLTGWWTDFSLLQQLELLGYQADEFTPSGKYAKVAEANLERVKALEKSGLGLGWPAKVGIGFVALGIPYLFTVYLFRFALYSLNAKPSQKID